MTSTNGWIDGCFISEKKINLPIGTHALHYGSAVFEGIRAYGGKPFKAPDHFARFHNSAALLHFTIPYSIEELLLATKQLLATTDFYHAYIRPLAWCGEGKLTVSNKQTIVHTAICIWERLPLITDEKNLTRSIRLNISAWRRPDPRTAPVHSKAAGMYMTSSISKVESEERGFDDSLMLTYDGYIAEGTSSNIFIVVKDVLFTPIPDCFLNGITRLTVLDIAKKAGIKVVETRIPIMKLGEASEVFLTGTAVEILPVRSIEDEENNQKWEFTPGGPITKRICSLFKGLINSQ